MEVPDMPVHAPADMEVLRTRARDLAAPGTEPSGGGDRVDLVVFRAGERTLAVLAAQAAETVSLAGPAAPTPLPGMPPFLHGIILVRGRAVAVNDALRLLGLPPSPEPPRVAVILRHNEMELALGADELAGLSSVSRSELTPPEAAGTQLPHVAGYTHSGTIVLDALSLLADPALLIDSAAKADASFPDSKERS